MFAVISDIHSNLEALTVVLNDIKKRGIKTIYCLGDIVGYGPNPIECLDLVIEKAEWCVLGNHDYAVLYEPTDFNYRAEQAILWTRKILETRKDTERNNERWHYLSGLPLRHSREINLSASTVTIDFVHASPRRPIHEYIFTDDVYTNPAKVRTLLDRVKRVCFVGHTHMPGVFLDGPDFYLPEKLGSVYSMLEEEKAIINIGSVGQPRDRDNRASYTYIKDNEVHFVRLEYDYRTTMNKILANEQLDDFHAERLKEGR